MDQNIGERCSSGQSASILESVLTFGMSSAQGSEAVNQSRDETNLEAEQSTKFHVDRTKIQPISSGDQDSELQSLGLDVYNQDEFEEGVLAQVDAELAAQEEIRLNMQLEKEMKAIQDDVSSCQDEVKYCDKIIQQIESDAQTNRDVKRRLNTVKMQKENKMKQLKRLEGRQKALIQRTQRSLEALQAEIEEQNSSKNASVQQCLGLPSASGNSETETERLVRLGEMTPFGTVMSAKDEPSTSKVSDFEKYLVDQQTKTSSKKSKSKSLKRSGSELTRPRKEDHLSTDEPNSKKMKKSGSVPVFGKSSKDGNYFDEQDKKTYRPFEKDFSDYKSKKRSIYPKLRHNFFGQSRPDFDPDGEYDSDDYHRDEDYQPSSAELMEQEEEYDRYNHQDIKFKREEVDLGAKKKKVPTATLR